MKTNLEHVGLSRSLTHHTGWPWKSPGTRGDSPAPGRHQAGPVLPAHWRSTARTAAALSSVLLTTVSPNGSVSSGKAEFLRWSVWMLPSIHLTPAAHILKRRPCWNAHRGPAAAPHGTRQRSVTSNADTNMKAALEVKPQVSTPSITSKIWMHGALSRKKSTYLQQLKSIVLLPK